MKIKDICKVSLKWDYVRVDCWMTMTLLAIFQNSFSHLGLWARRWWEEQRPHWFVCLLLCRWGILFSHPRDFTPVCTTELACAAKISDEFKKRSVKMIALSIDSVEDHRNWSKVGNTHMYKLCTSTSVWLRCVRSQTIFVERVRL